MTAIEKAVAELKRRGHTVERAEFPPAPLPGLYVVDGHELTENQILSVRGEFKIVEPDWVDCSMLGSPYEEQYDVRASAFAPRAWRHRMRKHTGEVEQEWTYSRAPDAHKPLP